VTGTNKNFLSSPVVEVVIRRSEGVTKRGVRNQVVIPEVIAHHANVIVIRIADVFIKIVEVVCLSHLHISE